MSSKHKEDGAQPEQGERRKGDRFDRFMQWGIVVLILAGFYFVNGAANDASQAVQNSRTEAAIRSSQRTADLRASCRRGSRKTAQLVNLYWLYYQSETQLNGSGINPRKIEQILVVLSPGERRFLTFLISSGKPSQRILRARASADFNTAYVNAQTIDLRDLRFVHGRTVLGSAREPRRWVRIAHYNCDQAFK